MSNSNRRRANYIKGTYQKIRLTEEQIASLQAATAKKEPVGPVAAVYMRANIISGFAPAGERPE